MADIAKMVARLELEASKFQAGMERAQKQVARFERNTTSSLGKIQKQFADFGKNMLRTFAVGSITTAVYGLTRAVTEAVKAGDEIARFATKSGLGAKAASELAYAARNAEIDLTSLGKGIKFMQVNLSKIGSKDGNEAKEILDAIGLSASDLQKMKPEEQLLAIGDAIKRLPNINDQTRAWGFFGSKIGLELAPAFEEGAEGLRKMMGEAERLGQSFTEEDLQKFKDADEAFDQMAAAGRGLAASLTIKITPAIVAVTEELTKLLALDFKDSNFLKFMLSAPHQKLAILADTFKNAGKSVQTVRGTIDRGPVTTDTPSGPRFAPDPPKAEDWAKLQPIIVEATRIFPDFNQMLKDTETDAQAAARALDVFKIQLEALKSVNLIDEAESIKRLLASQTEPLLDMKIPEVVEDFTKGMDEMTVYAEQAARNIQDALASFFMDFDKGLDGMVEGFLRALQSMAANLAASQLLGMLGGSLAGSSNGFLSALGTALMPKATGGSVSAGGAYMVGERGPEMFVPGASGTIVPNNQLGAGLTYAPVINAQGADASLRAALPGILQEHGKRMMTHIRDQMQRGAL